MNPWPYEYHIHPLVHRSFKMHYAAEGMKGKEWQSERGEALKKKCEWDWNVFDLFQIKIDVCFFVVN